MTIERQRFHQETLSKGVYGLFDCNVRFSSNDPAIIGVLEYLYEPSLVTREVSEEEKVHLNLMGDGLYQLYVRGLPVTFYQERWEVLLHFKARLLEFFWRGEPQPLLLHAGSVVKDKKGILLAGDDGSGKTTLTLGLVNLGFSFLSDEYGLCDRSGFMRSYPAPISVRCNSLVFQRNLLDLVERVRDDLFEINVWEPEERDEKKPLFPAPLVEKFDNGIPPRAILLLTPNFDAPPEIEPITNFDLVLSELTKNASWHRGSRLSRDEITMVLDKMLKGEKVAVFRLRVGGFDETLEMIEKLVDRL